MKDNQVLFLVEVKEWVNNEIMIIKAIDTINSWRENNIKTRFLVVSLLIETIAKAWR
jgi:hypothetical protein